jgi:hypothetical protein
MPGQPLCADNLLLLGEILKAASQYIDQCDEMMEEENDPRMLALACDQVLPLIEEIEGLRKKLIALESRMLKKLPHAREPIAGKASRKASRA